MADFGANRINYTGLAEASMSLLNKFGGQGKYNKAILIASGSDTYLTGSNFGATALLVSQSGAGTIHLPFGGTINMSSLSTGTIYEIGACRVQATVGSIYALYPGRRGSI